MFWQHIAYLSRNSEQEQQQQHRSSSLSPLLSCSQVKYIPFNSPIAWGPIIVAASGIAFTLATVGVFVQYNDTPLVSACD